MLCAPTAIVAAFAALASAPAASAAPCAKDVGAICIDGEAADYGALIDRLKGADVAILGERHDNPAHHAWQARIVAALAPRGLAFEMVPRAREDDANAARVAGGDLAEALEWEASGWPDWAMYAPIFDAAPEAWVAGGGVSAEALRTAVAEGAAAAFGEGAARYRLDERLDRETVEAMLDEQDRAHCGALPTAMLPGMAEAQQLRDAAFADAALRLIDAGHAPVALITGNGHARTDRGAPLYLRRAAPALRVVSVGMVEVGGDGRSGAPYDVSIFTEAHERGDPCETFAGSRKGG